MTYQAVKQLDLIVKAITQSNFVQGILLVNGVMNFNHVTMKNLTASGHVVLGTNSTGYDCEQRGMFQIQFNNVSSMTGNLQFLPNPFPNTPVLIPGVEVNDDNLDIFFRWKQVTATQATWKAINLAGTPITATVNIHWSGMA